MSKNRIVKKHCIFSETIFALMNVLAYVKSLTDHTNKLKQLFFSAMISHIIISTDILMLT